MNGRSWRAGIHRVGIMVILAGVLACGSTRVPVDLPDLGDTDIIVICLDTLRKDRLGMYGHPDAISPFMDRWSRDTIVFGDTASQSASTWTSHRSLFVSRYIWSHGPGDPDEPGTLAGRMRAAGYRTQAFVDGGKMHHRYGHAVGFDGYDDDGGHLETIIPKAQRWLLDHAGERFFLFLHTYDIHAPYNPSDGDDRVFVGNAPVPDSFRTQPPTYLNSLHLDPARMEWISGLYNGGVRTCDRRLAAFFHFLRAKEILDHAIVLVISDHGESLGERNYIGHHEPYYVQLEVPLLMQVPGLAGRLVPGVVENVDIMPTLLDLVGLEFPPEIHGISLREAIRWAAPADPVRWHIAEESERTVFREAGWKLIIGTDAAADRLYDLAMDPAENRNRLSGNETIRGELMAYVESFSGVSRETIRQVATERNLPVEIFTDTDQQLKQQLELLGYIEKPKPGMLSQALDTEN